jgi:hypothetical protein
MHVRTPSGSHFLLSLTLNHGYPIVTIKKKAEKTRPRFGVACLESIIFEQYETRREHGQNGTMGGDNVISSWVIAVFLLVGCAALPLPEQSVSGSETLLLS